MKICVTRVCESPFFVVQSLLATILRRMPLIWKRHSVCSMEMHIDGFTQDLEDYKRTCFFTDVNKSSLIKEFSILKGEFSTVNFSVEEIF